MKIHQVVLSVLAIVVAGNIVSAQDLKIVSPSDRTTKPAVLKLPAPPVDTNSMSSLEEESISASSPEVWFYLQELKRYEDPSNALRRRAEQKSAERRARMAARSWYGVSLSRPQANSTPFTYQYSNLRTTHATDVYRQQFYRTATQPVSGRQF